MRGYKQAIAIGLIALICFGLGYIFGLEAGVKECISYGSHLIKNFVNISFDEEKLAQLLYQYRGKLEIYGFS